MDRPVFTKFDHNGKFGLSWQQYDWSVEGSIGRGSAHRVQSFESEEVREYYIRALNAEWDLKEALQVIGSIKQTLSACFTKTGRIRRVRLMEAIGRIMR